MREDKRRQVKVASGMNVQNVKRPSLWKVLLIGGHSGMGKEDRDKAGPKRWE